MTETNEFLSAEWRYLAMLNYEIDPAVLLPFVPGGTELDIWHGKTFVSIVGFLFLKTKVLGLSIPFHTDFEEVNLRFYVRRRSEEGWRRGVVFIKEIVPKFAIATVARTVYNENYVALPMRHTLARSSAAGEPEVSVEYQWQFNNRWHHLRLKTTGGAEPIAAGSEEEFIAEHYWGYAAQIDGGCMEYQVEHPRWRVWQAGECEFEGDVAKLYGPMFVGTLQAAPSSAFLAEGSPVVVRQGVKKYG
jgi:uncharacterized protein YqjF (DUF2071 family)